MVYTTKPVKKVKKILNWLQQDWSRYEVDDVAEMLEQKFNVGVFVHHGRVLAHVHEFEIYRKFNGEWLNLLCRVEIPFSNFQKPLDF